MNATTTHQIKPDAARLAFLRDLDASLHLDVTDWEAGFIANLITNPRPLTEQQRAAIDQLRTTYEARL